MNQLTERTTAALAWLDSQLAICNAAPDGPWETSPNDDYLFGEETKGHIAIVKPESGFPYPWYLARIPFSAPSQNSIATFIAAARTGYPAMLEGMKTAIKGLQQFAASFDDIPNAAMSALNSLLTTIESLQ